MNEVPLLERLSAELDEVLVLAHGLAARARTLHDETVVLNETARLDEELRNLR